jgi:L-alanine-DL-glutamate epimerase-like enolase superfamily enzyme
MPLSRRNVFSKSYAFACMSTIGPVSLYKGGGKTLVSETHDPSGLPAWSFPSLYVTLKEPVLIRSVELLKTQGELMLVVTSKEGVKGVTQCNDRMQHLISLLRGLVIPHFINEDARGLPRLLDNAYRLNSNYKYAGMPLWNCIGTVEIALWDLLGRVAQKPVYELLGSRARTGCDVYISDWNREGDPEKISDQLLGKLKARARKALK